MKTRCRHLLLLLAVTITVLTFLILDQSELPHRKSLTEKQDQRQRADRRVLNQDHRQQADKSVLNQDQRQRADRSSLNQDQLQRADRSVLDCIPKDVTNFTCDMLFGKGSRAQNFTMSATFRESVSQFESASIAAFQANTPFFYKLDRIGASRNRVTQSLLLHYLASSTHVRTVCETGFLYGYSAFNYLTANDQLVVHSFDLPGVGLEDESHKMAKYLNDHYRGRLHVHYGNSIEEVPKYIDLDRSFRCDLIFVDGAHSYDAVLNDITNFASVASVARTDEITKHNLAEVLVVIDDLNNDGVAKAWDEARRLGIVGELMHCSYTDVSRTTGGLSFAVGKVVRQPVRK